MYDIYYLHLIAIMYSDFLCESNSAAVCSTHKIPTGKAEN